MEGRTFICSETNRTRARPTTVRALAPAGPSWPAIQRVGYDQFAEAIRQALRPLYMEGIGVRIISEFGWIIGKVPAT